MPDEPAADVISGGRDPDRRPAGPAGGWRWLAGGAVAVLIAGWITFHLTLGGPGRPPHRTPRLHRQPPPSWRRRCCTERPWRPGSAPGTVLFPLPLDTIDHQGAEAGMYVYVADTGARTLARGPGLPVPVTALPRFPAGSSDVVSARWAPDGPGLWIVATDGLFFQLAYWTGHGPLHVFPPQGGLACKIRRPGAIVAGPAVHRGAFGRGAGRFTRTVHGNRNRPSCAAAGLRLARLGPLSSAS